MVDSQDPGELEANRRRLVDVRCGVAEAALHEAEAAEARAIAAQKRSAEQMAAVTRLQSGGDPVLTKQLKDTAHQEFKAAVARAVDRASVEAAAAAWLAEINRLNQGLRQAEARIQSERAAADRLLAEWEDLADTAEAARAMADSAQRACEAAKRALEGAVGTGTGTSGRASGGSASTTPAATTGAAGGAASTGDAPAEPARYVPRFAGVPSPAYIRPAKVAASAASPLLEQTAGQAPLAPKPASGAPIPIPLAKHAHSPAAGSTHGSRPETHAEASAKTGPSNGVPAPRAAEANAATATAEGVTAAQPAEPSDGLFVDLNSPQRQVIVRLLHRDGEAMSWLAQTLAGSDVTARSRLQLSISALVDAVVGLAIEQVWFEFPVEGFWQLLTPDQAREVVRSLAALGFKYDGFGGFVDGRVPGQRDLSLAMGNAGVPPVRVRHWPTPTEAAGLFSGLRVVPDVFLATRAPSLTLGELVKLLGRRAERLTDLWNDWPRIRPLLFETELRRGPRGG